MGPISKLNIDNNDWYGVVAEPYRSASIIYMPLYMEAAPIQFVFNCRSDITLGIYYIIFFKSMENYLEK